MKKKFEENSNKIWLGKKPLYLCSPLKNGSSYMIYFDQKSLIFLQIILVAKIKALTFATPTKRVAQKSQKIFESLEATAA